ncbi:hypothetical protein HPB49_014734 [Dermacentor silvarum]|uniref:Uncharacterized protein n=1 Tax=Dermacentor silvarum TaxID=543639 RepID=A0ACB8CXW9_DERSI|nr:hypothetical protein HPB49_014734 [Dermacentor silvarum]
MRLSTCCQIVLVVGLLWPIWDTFNSIEAKNAEKEATWLKYWCCLGSFLVLENMLGLVLCGLPETSHGSAIRLAVLVCIQAYVSQAPEQLYERAFRFQMKLWEPDIDKVLNYTVAETTLIA